MELDRDAWFIRLYFICARLQRMALSRTGALPEPRSICMLLRMYLWGLLSLPVIVLAYGFLLVLICVALAVIFGVAVAAFYAVFRGNTHIGSDSRALFLAAACIVATVVVIGFIGEALGKLFRNHPRTSSKVARPSKKRNERHKKTPFGEVFGQWLRDIDEKTCTPIVLK